MTEPRLKAIVVCSQVETGPPLVLHDVRRHWREPPGAFWLVADVENPTEQPFSWQFQLARRGRVVDSSVETLEPRSPIQFYASNEVHVVDAKPVIYRVRWLLNGNLAGTIDVDFGFPEAAP